MITGHIVDRSLRSVARVVLVLALAATPSVAALVAVTGTKVSIEPPPGFVPATLFPGVENAELASSIMITEAPAPISEMKGAFNAENARSKGMTLRSSEDVTIDGRSARLVSATQVGPEGITFEKWLAVFGTSTTTVMVVATYPQELAPKLQEPMRTAVLSAKWNPDAKVDSLAGLSFRVSESEHLKIQHRMANALMLGPSGKLPRPPSEPMMIVAPSVSPVRIPDLEQFARQRIALTEQITDLRDVEGTPTEVDGRPAFEVTAKAKDRKTGTPLAVYQLALVDGEIYYLVVGMVGVERSAELLPEFRSVAKSLKIVPQKPASTTPEKKAPKTHSAGGGAARPKDDTTSLAFVLLPKAELPSADAIVQAFDRFSTAKDERLRAMPSDAESGGGHGLELELSSGEKAIVVLAPLAVPNGEADDLAELSVSSVGTGWKLPPHQAHLVVTMSGAPARSKETVSRFTSLLAAVTAASDAVGVYWGSAGATHDPRFFTSVAERHEDDARIMLWTGVSIASEPDGRVSLLSTGMQQLGLPDLLLIAPASEKDSVLQTFFGLLDYVADRGEPLPEGDTVGYTADQRLPVHYVPSPVAPDVQVWRVEVK